MNYDEQLLNLLPDEQIELLVRSIPAGFAVVASNRQWQFAEHLRLVNSYLMKLARREITRLMIFMPHRTGKLCDDSTQVLITEGWKNHGDLKVNDFVFGLDGKPKKILAVGDKDYANIEVTFVNGYKIKVHEKRRKGVHVNDLILSKIINIFEEHSLEVKLIVDRSQCHRSSGNPGRGE